MQAGEQQQKQQAQAHRDAGRCLQMAAEHCERAAQAYERGDAHEGQRLAQESERHSAEAKQAMQKAQQA